MTMKGIYYADPTSHQFTYSDIVPDDYTLKENETFENPTGKLEPAKLVNGSWIDATQEEHQAYLDAMQQDYLRQHPEASQPAEPDKGDQAVNLLGQQITKIQQQQTTMMQSINTLGQLLAKAQGTTTDTKAQA
ncbi:hypothetical protein [Limosilactobacillus reuteri]|uniref:hypothetical protein n=2 Tax=Limosilactobacillus reuteri TaxID=1598 RepID=UPI00146B8EBF|nr:hypothetical protein [Limosilactobacillus reuteri]NMV61378.1 hypothetical protein [Limosilactobacillus reuteri]